MNSKICLYTLVMLIVAMAACKKQDDWLEARRQRSDVLPATLSDFQAILDQPIHVNESYPMLGLTGTDNLFITDDNLNTLPEDERLAYTWQKDLFPTGVSGDYTNMYATVSPINIVLEGLAKLPANAAGYIDVRGQALFARAFKFYHLAQLFCKPYDAASASTDPGIVLRTVTDPTIIVSRSSVQQTYEFLINELKEAIGLLPLTPKYRTRASKPAAQALLAKVYLVMADYENALQYANEALTNYSTLLDFNNGLHVNPANAFTFNPFSANPALNNPEIIFYAMGQLYFSIIPGLGVQHVDSMLFSSYAIDDLRRTAFFQDNGGTDVRLKGTYTGTYYNFCGIATNEVLLIRAECHARKGNIAGAMNDLNNLLRNRFISGAYTDQTAVSANEALEKVLVERRKELPFTGQVRWEDLRRLNKEPGLAKVLKRIVDNTEYFLQPGDKRYVFPIPGNEIRLAGIQQNER